MQIPTICQAATGKRVDVPGVPQNGKVSGTRRRGELSGCRQPDGVVVAGALPPLVAGPDPWRPVEA